jgi:hypothetical protein
LSELDDSDSLYTFDRRGLAALALKDKFGDGRVIRGALINAATQEIKTKIGNAESELKSHVDNVCGGFREQSNAHHIAKMKQGDDHHNAQMRALTRIEAHGSKFKETQAEAILSLRASVRESVRDELRQQLEEERARNEQKMEEERARCEARYVADREENRRRHNAIMESMKKEQPSASKAPKDIVECGRYLDFGKGEVKCVKEDDSTVMSGVTTMEKSSVVTEATAKKTRASAKKTCIPTRSRVMTRRMNLERRFVLKIMVR